MRPEAGQWVLVFGQVTDGANHHPDDVVVRFESHNENWDGHIRLDHVTPADVLPPNVVRCSALFAYPGGPSGILATCVLYNRHPGLHRDVEGTGFTDGDIVGYMEPL